MSVMNSVDFVILTEFQLEKVKYQGGIFQSEQNKSTWGVVQAGDALRADPVLQLTVLSPGNFQIKITTKCISVKCGLSSTSFQTFVLD